MNSKFFKASFNSFSRQTPPISRIIKVKSYTLLHFSVALLKISGPLTLTLTLGMSSLIHILNF